MMTKKSRGAWLNSAKVLELSCKPGWTLMLNYIGYPSNCQTIPWDRAKSAISDFVSSRMWMFGKAAQAS